jgi:hypothetical protein
MGCLSPDERLAAVLYGRSSGGAAGSVAHYVSVRPTGGDAEVVIFEMFKGYNIRLDWRKDSALTIGYPAGSIISGRDGQTFTKTVAGRQVEVRLIGIPSQHGLFGSGESECVGGRPNMPLQPTSGALGATAEPKRQ